MSRLKVAVPVVLALIWLLISNDVLPAIDVKHMELLGDAREDSHFAQALQDRRRSWRQRTYEIWKARRRAAAYVDPAQLSFNTIDSVANLFTGEGEASLLESVFHKFVDNQVAVSRARAAQDGNRQMINLIDDLRATVPSSAERARSVEEYIRRATIDYSTMVVDDEGDDSVSAARHNRVLFEMARHMLAVKFVNDVHDHDGQDMALKLDHMERLGEQLFQRDKLLEEIATDARNFQLDYHDFLQQYESSDQVQNRHIDALYGKLVAVRDDATSIGAAFVSADDDITQITDDLRVLRDNQRFDRTLIFGNLLPEKQLEVLENRPGFLAGTGIDEDVLKARLRFRVDAQELVSDALALERSGLAVVRVLVETGLVSTEAEARIEASSQAATAIAKARAAIISNDPSAEEQMGTAANAVIGALAAIDVVDETDAATLKTAVGVGFLAAGLFPPNPTLILSGASMILGSGVGGSRDPELKRALAQIAERLDSIDQRLITIDGKIMDLLDGQRETNEAIARLQDTVIEGLDDLILSTKRLRLEEVATRATLVATSALGFKLNACKSFVDGRSGPVGEFTEVQAKIPNTGFTIGEFVEWDALVDYYNSEQLSFKECFEAISNVFGVHAGGQFSPLITMATYANGGGGNLSSYIEPGFRPLSELFARSFPVGERDGGGRHAGVDVFCSLLNSPLSYDEIGYRGSNSSRCRSGGSRDVDPTAALRGLAADEDLQTMEIPNLIHPNWLQYYAYLLMEVLPYRSLIDDEYKIRRPEKLLSADDRVGEIRGREANGLIRGAYRLVNIAIAQQVLLTGDVMLPVIHRVLWGSQEGTEDRRDVVAILEHHKNLSRNYLVMQLSRELHRHNSGIDYDGVGFFGRNLEEYAKLYRCRSRSGSRDVDSGVATDCDSPTLAGYEDLFGSQWVFHSSKNVVFVPIELLSDQADLADPQRYLALDLPTPEEIEVGRYHAPAEYFELLLLRDRLVDYALRNDLAFVSNDDGWVVDTHGNYVY